MTDEEIVVEWYQSDDARPVEKVFNTEQEALEFAHKELGFNREWSIWAHRFIDANYTNYN